MSGSYYQNYYYEKTLQRAKKSRGNKTVFLSLAVEVVKWIVLKY